jgi:hypothetical protein
MIFNRSPSPSNVLLLSVLQANTYLAVFSQWTMFSRAIVLYSHLNKVTAAYRDQSEILVAFFANSLIVIKQDEPNQSGKKNRLHI